MTPSPWPRCRLALAADLVAGRILLLDAAVRYRSIDAGCRGHPVLNRSVYPDLTDDERLCRMVIDHAEGQVGDVGGRAAVRRLYDELHDLKARGALVLPAPDVSVAVPWADACGHGLAS
ncbi:MAG TPA: hypothetical protein VGF55_10200 [Gemmataceae bacterium]|jgi:hypothetical protein